MKKLDLIIFDFLKGQFKEHPNCNKIGFNVYNFSDGTISACEESVSVNDKAWDDLLDPKLLIVNEKLQDAISSLQKIDEAAEIKVKLIELSEETWERACSNPLNKIWKEFFQGENIRQFTTIITKEFRKRFPARYVDYVSVEVSKDGKVIYYPDGEDE